MTVSGPVDQDLDVGRAAFARFGHPTILCKLVLTIAGAVFAYLLLLRAFDAWWPLADIRSLLPSPLQAFLGSGVLALWLTGAPVAKYCGLVRPHGRDIVLGVACTAAFQLATLGLLLLLGVEFSAAGLTPWFVLRHAVGAVIYAPVFEEIVFRGFAYHRLAQTRLGIAGAIVVTSLAWALIHLDPTLPDRGSHPIFVPFIFFLGLLFGWLRKRSGSTVLTILVHAQWNLIAYVSWAALALRSL